MRKGIINLLILLSVFIFQSCTDGGVDYKKDNGVIDAGQQMTNGADWYKNAVFYHIWVKAFRDGKYDDGIGDLKGIINKLDYLNDGDPTTDTDLGVTGIWLSPIFECEYKENNMHGYDATDYYRINDRFGNSADVKTLLDEAHSRGIRVIFDFVPNHIATTHPWADDRSLCVWDSSPDNGWGKPWGGGSWKDVWTSSGGSYYYHAFTDNMIDIDYSNPVAKQKMKDVVSYWLDRGFDGVRFDAVKYLHENGPGDAQNTTGTHNILKEYRTLIDSYSGTGSNKMFVSEAWVGSHTTQTSYYGNGTDESNMCFDFQYAYAVNNIVNNVSNPNYIADLLNYQKANYPSGAHTATFLSNHDEVLDRPATLYGGDKNKIVLAAAFNILSHGTPFIYYGNEVGMEDGVQSGDLRFRQPMAWNKVTSQKNNPQSILSWYRYLIKAKLAYEPLRTSNFEIKDYGYGVFVIVRKNNAGTESMVVAFNVTSTVKDYVTADLGLGSDRPVSAIIGETKGVNSLTGTQYHFEDIPPYGVRVLYVGDSTKPNIVGDIQ